VQNAWNDILFCDYKRGIFGATPAEIMHCMQQGLYQYIVKQLFEQKKIKRKPKTGCKANKKRKQSLQDLSEASSSESESENEDNWTSTVELSIKCVFSDKYGKRFDNIAKTYGYYLMHQSDRNLPRTHINTNYTSVANKNANEMTSIFIVILMVFASSEGTYLDQELGDKRSAQYIHLFELMLMMEYFCKSNKLTRKTIQLFQQVLPYLMETLKKTLDRQTGNQMKIIKFHLPLHFAEDMLRFGSMSNYDSGIGEMHHKEFAKLAAQNTQRRKCTFEKQAATRLIENLAIDRAFNDVFPGINYNETQSINNNENKRYVIEFCAKQNELMYVSNKTSERKRVDWKDKVFQKQLCRICIDAISQGNLQPPIRFFTQHNRSGNIFRADPCYNKSSKEPWYDWAYINWGEDNINCVPAKLLLFMEIHDNQITNPFQFGDAFITEPGDYAITYSFESNMQQKAHLDSILVEYGQIVMSKQPGQNDLEPAVYPVIVDSIVSCCIVVPYLTSEDPIVAKEWLLLKARDKWGNIFEAFMQTVIV
jgi:hypothetical protein